MWRGRALRTGEPVALKVVDLTDAAAHRSARAEAALLSALDHPHLVRLHELVSDGDQAILVLDYAAGGNLAQLLERRSRITVGELVTAVSPIAAAVAYIHEEGLVHGDISPANILFTAEGQPVLADLGVASMCGSAEEQRSTLAYLDPAVANGGAAGPPSDVFMLAAISLHALTGRPPWVALTPQGLVDAAASGDIADLDDRLGAVSEDVAAIVRRGLSALPHARGTAAEFALDLRHAATPAPLELAAGQLRFGGAEVDADAGLTVAGDGSDTEHEARYRPRHSGSLPHVEPTASSAPTESRAGRAVDRARSLSDVALDRPEFARPEFGRVLDRSRPSPGDLQGACTGEVDESRAMTLTHQVRAKVRPAAPPPPRFGPGWRRWGLSAAGVGAVVACAATALMVGWRPASFGGAAHADSDPPSPAPVSGPRTSAVRSPAQSTHQSSGGPSPATTIPPTTATVTTAPATMAPAPTPPTGAAVAIVEWQRVLAGLDAHRQHAFATADGGELAKVYVAGPLLTQDVRVLHGTLGPGCTVRGLHTTYRVLRARAEGSGAFVVTAAASLAPAVLRCPATADEQTAPMQAGALTIRLVTTSAGYRIAGLNQPSAR